MTSPFDPVMHDFFLKGRLPNPEILIYYTVTQLHCVHCTVSTLYCVRWTVEYKYSLYLLTLVWMEEGGGLFICQSIKTFYKGVARSLSEVDFHEKSWIFFFTESELFRTRYQLANSDDFSWCQKVSVPTKTVRVELMTACAARTQPASQWVELMQACSLATVTNSESGAHDSMHIHYYGCQL